MNQEIERQKRFAEALEELRSIMSASPTQSMPFAHIVAVADAYGVEATELTRALGQTAQEKSGEKHG